MNIKTFCSIGIGLLFILASYGQQSSRHAIGLRLGDSRGFDAEISYQLFVSSNNRLEFDFGWRNQENFDAIKITALYQWVYNLDKGFNWYVGPGGGIGFIDANGNNVNDGSSSFVYVAGVVGIEYDFDIPLLLSFDFRPEINIGSGSDLNFGLGVGARYQF